MIFKKCFKCQCEKPLDAFYKHSMMQDGHLNKCKECTKKDTLENRQAKLEKYRQYDRMRASMPHRVAQRSEINKRWFEQHPDRKRAQTKLGRALQKGLVKKQPCIVCGALKSEAHHPDYSRPLDVVWMCTPHHAQTHAMARKLEGAA
jgi:hypothetical protein